MSEKSAIRVGISVGDINGIGLEVIIKTLQNPDILEHFTPVIFASNKVVSFMMKHLKIEYAFNGVMNLNSVIDKKVNVMNCWKEIPQFDLGKETPEAGRCAFDSLKKATEALKTGGIDVLVTAPINKKNIQSEEFNFPGHTDFLAQELGGESLMFLVSDDLRVGLFTDHIPLKEVASTITEELILKKIRIVNQSLINDFGIRRPKIAVLGLNPHCGDQGVIGSEDDELISPAIKKISEQEKILVFGPYSSDSFFVSEYQKFDAILAPYHDQGLIPFKTLSFGQGVNFTAGLNKVRTSPDHGTAYSIAGQGIADESSFRKAIFTAIDIFRNRKLQTELLKNPLKISEKQSAENE